MLVRAVERGRRDFACGVNEQERSWIKESDEMERQVRNIVLVLAMTAAVASGNFVPIDFSQHHNSNMNGYLAPYFSTGVFTAPDGAVFHTPLSGARIWTGSGSGLVSIDIPVHVYAVDVVHTLIVTAWGTTQTNHFWLEFYATGDAPGNPSHVVQLEGNREIRDFNQGGYTNSIVATDNDGDGATAMNVISVANASYGTEDRLDKQEIDLPVLFDTTWLETIRIVDNGGSSFQRGLFYGVTAELVPEPASLVLVGLGGLALMRRRRS